MRATELTSNFSDQSGDQSRAVEAGQPADVVEFARARHDQAGRRRDRPLADWNKNQYNGIVTDSVVTLMVRPGNPKNIQSFDDCCPTTTSR